MIYNYICLNVWRAQRTPESMMIEPLWPYKSNQDRHYSLSVAVGDLHSIFSWSVTAFSTNSISYLARGRHVQSLVSLFYKVKCFIVRYLNVQFTNQSHQMWYIYILYIIFISQHSNIDHGLLLEGFEIHDEKKKNSYTSNAEQFFLLYIYNVNPFRAI